jgi:hypothetical protein
VENELLVVDTTVTEMADTHFIRPEMRFKAEECPAFSANHIPKTVLSSSPVVAEVAFTVHIQTAPAADHRGKMQTTVEIQAERNPRGERVHTPAQL